MSGSRRRSTNRLIPTSRKNSQNTGAVYSTASWKPSIASAPRPTSSSASPPWTSIATRGEPLRSSQRPMNASAGKSRPTAYTLRAPVISVALADVSAAATTIPLISTAPGPPNTCCIRSAATASDPAMPPKPSTRR